jgi:hypothetical protein
MAVLKDYELYVVTNSAMYVGLSMCGNEVYTNKGKAEKALEQEKQLNGMSGFKYEVMTLSDYVSEYGRQRYYEGQANERDRNCE